MSKPNQHICPPAVPGSRAMALKLTKEGWEVHLFRNGKWELKWGPNKDQLRMHEATKVIVARDLWPAEDAP